MEENNSQNNQNDDYIDFSHIFQSNYSSNGKQTEDDYKSIILVSYNIYNTLFISKYYYYSPKIV